MKKIIAFILVMIMAFALPVTSFASNNETVVETIYMNEYDYIVALQNATQEELDAMGLSRTEADTIIADFEVALQERVLLSEETLYGLGYTQDEIDALHTYNERSIMSVETMRAITGTCTGYITASYATAKEVTFKYDWVWDHAPIMKLKDSVAMCWIAYDSNGHEVDVTKTGEKCSISYYWNGSVQFTRSGTQQPNLSFNTINVQFDESEKFQSSTTRTEEAYAGNGYLRVTVKVESGVNNSINYIKVAALYGHSILGSDAPSIGFSIPGSISISFEIKIDVAKHARSFGVGYDGTSYQKEYISLPKDKGAIVAFVDEIEVPGRYRVFIENSGQSTETIIGHIAIKKR